MRRLALVLAACGSSPPPPVRNEAKPSPPTLETQIGAAHIVLYDRPTITGLDSAFAPRALPSTSAFVVDLQKDDSGWSGTIGRVPLAGCCMAPLPVDAPKLENGTWKIVSRGEGPVEGSFWGCGDGVRELVLVPRGDGDYDVTCGPEKAVVGVTSSVADRLKRWEHDQLDHMFATVPRMKKVKDAWTFDGQPLVRCVAMARKCDLADIVAACELGESHIVKIRDNKAEVWSGNTAYDGAAQCVKGVLPGVD